MCQGGENLENIYIDESGSMTKKGLRYNSNKKFVICMIRVKDGLKLNRAFKRFVSKNLEDLRKLDGGENKMFYPDGNFKELKGSMLDLAMKEKFIDFFCRNDLFEIYYIVSDNVKVKPYFYANTSRAFNYLVKNCIEYATKNNLLKKNYYNLLIDERNIRTDTKATLKEYINTELVTGQNLHDGFSVDYFASETKAMIQLADVFSNIFYVSLYRKILLDKIVIMEKNGYIKLVYNFPIY